MRLGASKKKQDQADKAIIGLCLIKGREVLDQDIDSLVGLYQSSCLYPVVSNLFAC